MRIKILALSLGMLGNTLLGNDPSPGSIELSKLHLVAIQQVAVPARQEGQIHSVPARLGTLVKMGQVLAKLDDEDARQAVDQAQLNLGLAQKMTSDRNTFEFEIEAHEVAKREYDRAKQLRERVPDGVSASELDALHLDVARTAEALQTAKHEKDLALGNEQLREVELQGAKLKLKRRLVVAPFNGLVTNVYRTEGEWVKPGDQVARLVRMDRLRVDAFVDVSAVDWNLAKADVKMRVRVPDRGRQTYAGTVVFVNPEVDPFNNQVQVRIEFDNRHGQLQPGFQVEVVVKPRRKN